MTRSADKHINHFLKNFSFGNTVTSIDEFLKCAQAWGVQPAKIALIAEIVKIVWERNPEETRLLSICLNDPAVYRLLQSGDTNGVQGMEASGMKRYLQAMQPTCYEDIMVLQAIYRPSLLTNGIADMLIARKQGKEPVVTVHPILKKILKHSWGFIIFKEQITAIAEKLAGFNRNEALALFEIVRNGITEEKSACLLTFVKGCCKQTKITEELAEKIFTEMETSAGNCYPEALANLNATTAFYFAYLKANFQEEFKTVLDKVKPGWNDKKFKMRQSRNKIDASRFLSFVLRHKPEAIDIKLDAAGWVNIDELITKSAGIIKLTADSIRTIVAESDKQRFAISDDGVRIRAHQGHSIAVNLGLGNTGPPEILYYGTVLRNLPAIRKQGIVRGARNHVHLSVDKETATVVGKRHGKPVVLTVGAGRMHQDGFKFVLSENGVWLTEQVPEKYISGHRN